MFLGAEVGYPVTTVVANDADTNPSIIYQFTPTGNPGSMFAIDQYSGSISLAEPLDREIQDLHSLEIQASDGVYTDMLTLVVRVRDENDNEPHFSQQSYQVSIKIKVHFVGHFTPSKLQTTWQSKNKIQQQKTCSNCHP